ncbi:MAG: hypothetical protein HOH66_04360 [Rhodospirillaceae bacterium]|jgi:hypothetical protein|nr:hypothetical protein [Rhodospirillaceae bacterium]
MARAGGFSVLAVFLLALAIRLAVVGVFVAEYDRYESAIEGRPTVHAMVKSDAGKFFREGVGLVEHYRDSGSWAVQMADGPFLYGRAIALYGAITDKVRFLPDRVFPTGMVGWFFAFQALTCALGVAALYAALRKTLPGGVALLASLFLALEPTTVQYAGALFSEALYFAFVMGAMAIFIALVVRSGDGSRMVWRGAAWFGLGLLLGIAYLQRPISLALPVAFVLATCVAFRGRSFGRTVALSIALVVGYGAVLIGLGFHNQAATGHFAVTPGQASNDPLQYIAPRVLALAQDPDLSVTDLNDAPAVDLQAAALRARVDEAARDPATGAVDPIRLDTVSVDLALAVFAEHPWLTAEVIGWHVFRATGHVNPFQLYFFYDQIYKPRDGVLDRRQTEARYSYLPWIAAYSFLVLVPVLIGWAVATRALWRIRRPGGIRPPIPLWLHLLLTLMILYYPAIGGWLGNDRYILPNILPYSVYWALALTWLTAHWRLRRAALRS